MIVLPSPAELFPKIHFQTDTVDSVLLIASSSAVSQRSVAEYSSMFVQILCDCGMHTQWCNSELLVLFACDDAVLLDGFLKPRPS